MGLRRELAVCRLFWFLFLLLSLRNFLPALRFGDGSDSPALYRLLLGGYIWVSTLRVMHTCALFACHFCFLACDTISLERNHSSPRFLFLHLQSRWDEVSCAATEAVHRSTLLLSGCDFVLKSIFQSFLLQM